MIEDNLTAAMLGLRVQEIRLEVFGDNKSGVEAIASLLSIPAKTWENFEEGVTMPAPLMLHFIVATGANPEWLLTGSGSRFSDSRQVSEFRSVKKTVRDPSEN